MIAAIAPYDYWLGHPVVLDIAPASDITSRDRRLTRTATLDGGAVFADGGFCEADRTLTLQARALTRAKADALTAILSYSRIVAAVPSGLFICRAKSFAFVGAAETTMTLWVESRLL